MKKNLKILFFLFICTYTINGQSVENGIIDLRNTNFQDNDLISLKGNWKFFFNRTFDELSDTTSFDFITVPSNWVKFSYPKKGYAVYKVKILMPEVSGSVFLDIGKQSNNYNLYINGVKIASVGQFGIDKKSSIPDYDLLTVSLPKNTDTIEIALEVSNFNYRKSGLWEPLFIGKIIKLQSKFKRKFVFDAFLLGALLVLLIYHLILYFQIFKQKIYQYKSLLWFSLLAFFAILRLGVTGEMLFKELFSNLSWFLIVRIEFISFFMVLGMSVKYIYVLFSDEFSKKIADSLFFLSIIISGTTVFVPVFISSHFIIPFEILTVVVIIYMFWGIIKAFIKKRPLSVHVLIAFIIVSLSAFNDILYSQHIINSAYIFPVGIFIFFIIHAVSLSDQITSSVFKLNKLSEELKNSNLNLEKKVVERTIKINNQKELLAQSHLEFRNSFLNLQKLNVIAQKIISLLDVQQITNSVYQSVNEIMDASGFGIGLYDQKKNVLSFSNYVEKGEILPYDEVNLEDTNNLATWCFLNQDDVLIGNVLQEAQKYVENLSIPEHGEFTTSIIYVPLFTAKKIGVLTVQSFQKNAYKIHHLDLIKNLASFVAIAIQNATTYLELEKLSFVASKTDNYVLIVDKNDKITWINEGFSNLTGYKKEEVLGKKPSHVLRFDKSEYEIIEQIDEAIFKKFEVFKGIVTNYKKNNQSFKVAITINSILDKNGELDHYFVIGTDISEKVKYEQELQRQRDIAIEQKNRLIESVKKIKQSEKIIKERNFELKQMSLVVSNTDNAVMIIDTLGQIKWINSGFTKLYGYTLEEFKKRGNSIFFAATNKEVVTLINKALKTGQTVSYEAELSKKNGEKIWIQTTWTPIFDDFDNLIQLLGIDSDISKQKEVEEKLILKNKEILHKNQQITSSIVYAERIQKALLAPYVGVNKVIKQFKANYDFFTEYFIFYKPKDIISGDFYWAKAFDKFIIFIAADCTGHGVPGAFMSALGIAFINDIITSKNSKPPNIILNELRERVISSLNQLDSNSLSKDGMDITIVKINIESLEMQFAGAYQPIYRVTNADGEINILKYRTDRMPIGIHQNSIVDFKNFSVQLAENDAVYLSSDGFISQFGGKNNETFRSNRYRELLKKIYKYNMANQKENMFNCLKKWQGENEQVDDILVIGIKIIKN
ncbi:MAG: PAS domain S-box protein [Bacteroidales bacterium]|nr:PAS domain S-box protein [Bacteroidales bacterium]